jgi:arylsulfatase A-like enzyme
MSDDHAAHAMSCYGSRVNQTPHLDRIAREGVRFSNCFCTNSICTPSRATILTGLHSHVSGVTTLATPLDPGAVHYPGLMRGAGYQAAMIGKWHLLSVPAGFDHYSVLNSHGGHGTYFDPEMLENGVVRPYKGYVTDVITDLSLDWLARRDRAKPFCLMVHHKAPHRAWLVDDAHKALFNDGDLAYPDNFDDDYSNRAGAARAARMRIESDFNYDDMKCVGPKDNPWWTPIPVPEVLEGFRLKLAEGRDIAFRSHAEMKRWKYQRYMKDYLRCVAGVDDSTGRLLDWLDREGLAEDTMVVYTSDQGFFLGDHGWFDKRFMYEESLRMPLLMRYPRGAKAGHVCGDIVLNLDFAQTFLDFAECPAPGNMQGRSFRPLLEGRRPADWRASMYYRYWMHKGDHNVYAHYGVRTLDHKLIYYYADPLGQPGTVDERHKPEWELFDLGKDPREMRSVYNDPAYAGTVKELTRELHALQADCGDKRYGGEG